MAQPGSATTVATAAHAARHAAPPGAKTLGATGLTVSRLGFGGYRVDDETPEHREALTRALQAGVNLVDTSTNYTDGGSERLVGAVLAELVHAGRLRREEVVVVSKIGYVQGQNLALAREREAAGRPFPEMVKYGEGIWHCLHPEFLADQLARSLGRLGLDTLDVCLLHNPEYFLADAEHLGASPLAARRDEFYRRLEAAFRFFEGRVAAGALRFYGVSSNTAATPVANAEATSLTRMLEAARAAGGDDPHHFRVLQLPMNLFESNGALVPTDGPDGRGTGPGWAARQGIGVLLNRPLNAIVGGSMLRLAGVPVDADPTSLDDRLRAVADLEAEYRAVLVPAIRVAPGSHPPDRFFRWGEELASLRGRVHSLAQWEHIEGQVARLVQQVVRALDGGLSGSLAAPWEGWRERYLPALAGLLAAFRREGARQSRALTDAVEGAIDPWLPAERRGEPLSRKALWVLASTPGVSTVLVGMRRPAYVDDALGIVGWPPLVDARPVYEAVRGLALPPA